LDRIDEVVATCMLIWHQPISLVDYEFRCAVRHEVRGKCAEERVFWGQRQTVRRSLLLFVTTFAMIWGCQRLEAAGNGWNEKQR
jgi:hypothetical protein